MVYRGHLLILEPPRSFFHSELMELPFSVHRHRRHHHHSRDLQHPGDPQHLDVSAQDEDGQLPPHQEPLHRGPRWGLRCAASATSGHCQGCLGLWRCDV